MGGVGVGGTDMSVCSGIKVLSVSYNDMSLYEVPLYIK